MPARGESDPVALFPLPGIPRSHVGDLTHSINRELDTIEENTHEENVLLGCHISHLRNAVLKEASESAEILFQDASDKAGIQFLRNLRDGNIMLPDNHPLFSYLERLQTASHMLALGNWRLIYVAFEQLPERGRYTQQDYEDFFQIGFIALLNAAERYNPYHTDNTHQAVDEPYAFSTYAVQTIVGAMKSERHQFVDISVSRHAMELYGRYIQMREHLTHVLSGNIPTHTDIVAATLLKQNPQFQDIDPTIEEIERFKKKHRVTPEKKGDKYFQERSGVFAYLVNVIEHSLSLDQPQQRQYRSAETGEIHMYQTPLSETDNAGFVDGSQDPEHVRTTNELHEIIVDLLSQLYPEKLREIMTYHFGIEDGKIKIFRETAGKFGCSVENIRQYTQRGTRKLRHPSQAIRILDFLTE